MEEHTRGELRRIGKQIRARRIAAGITQEKFAELARIDYTYVSRIELGRANVSWEIVSRIARALRMKPSELIHSAGV